MIIIWLCLIAILLLVIELYKLIINYRKWIYVNNSNNHSIEHMTYVITSIIILLCMIFKFNNIILNLIIIFDFIIISFHLKSERLDSLKNKNANNK